MVCHAHHDVFHESSISPQLPDDTLAALFRLFIEWILSFGKSYQPDGPADHSFDASTQFASAEYSCGRHHDVLCVVFLDFYMCAGSSCA